MKGRPRAIWLTGVVVDGKLERAPLAGRQGDPAPPIDQLDGQLGRVEPLPTVRAGVVRDVEDRADHDRRDGRRRWRRRRDGARQGGLTPGPDDPQHHG